MKVLRFRGAPRVPGQGVILGLSKGLRFAIVFRL